jgi:hypothetical protein
MIKQATLIHRFIIYPYYWNLDVKNPHVGEVEQELGSQELVERILGKEEEIKNIIIKLE